MVNDPTSDVALSNAGDTTEPQQSTSNGGNSSLGKHEREEETAVMDESDDDEGPMPLPAGADPLDGIPAKKRKGLASILPILQSRLLKFHLKCSSQA